MNSHLTRDFDENVAGFESLSRRVNNQDDFRVVGNDAERFVLREPPPLRSLPGTAVVLAVGILIVLNRSWEEDPMLRTIGFIMVALGIIFPLVVVVKMLLNVVHVDLNNEGIAAKGPKVNGAMRWAEVTNWAVDPKGSGLVLMSGERKLKIISPNGRGDDEVFALGEVIDRYVSAARQQLANRAVKRPNRSERVHVDPDSDFGFDK
jgi:hypothetical protein